MPDQDFLEYSQSFMHLYQDYMS